MTAHPYRTPYTHELEPAVAASDGGTSIAFGVLAFTGAVQVAMSLVEPAQPSACTLLGAAALVAGLGWFARRHEH